MTQGNARRRRSFVYGHVAEYLAAAYLMLKGYRLLAMREKTPLGEIDLILRKADLIIMVEVKARRQVEDGVFAVTNAAQRRIRNAADLWIARRKDQARLSMRFDIVVIRPFRWPTHLADAF